MATHKNLSAYYENCKYAYILEYFVKAKDAAALQAELSLLDIDYVGIYKECMLPKNPEKDKQKDFYVWPSV